MSSKADKKVIFVGLFLILLFWISEAALHAFVFQKGNFFRWLFTSDLHEIWMRSIVTLILITFSMFAQSAVMRRKRAEEKTEFAYAELDQIFNTAADGMRLIDRDHNMLKVNQTFADMAGINKRETAGKKCYEIFGGPYCHTQNCSLKRIMGGEERIEIELLKERRDGVKVPCILVATPFRSPSGELIGIVEDFRDITERRSTEDALRESEERLKSQYKGIPLPTYTWQKIDNDFVLMDYNYAAEEITRGKIADWLGVKFSEMYKDMPRVRDEIWQCFKEKTIIKAEMPYKFRSFDKEAFFVVHYSYVPPDLVLVHTQDITERKRAEENLIRRQKALQSVYKMATTLCSSFEEHCDRVVLNLSQLLDVPFVEVQYIEGDKIKVISRILDEELTHNELITSTEKSPCTFVSEKDEVYQIKGSLAQLFPDNTFISQYKFKTYVGVPIRTRAGQANGLLCAMDYEERTFGDDEIYLMEIFAKYISHEMERNVMETQLRQSEKMKVLGQLTAGVAHEVRNPLNAILAVTEALYQDIGDKSEYKPYFHYIRTQVDRLSELMEDLLELGKPIQSSRLHAESLPAICAAAVDLWEQASSTHPNKVRLELPADNKSLDVIADGQKLQQVLLNLLENAAEHSPGDSEILLTIPDSPEDNIKVRVTDRGTGIVPENLQRVFEPFFTTRKKGTGLGLSIVRHIIEAHGGSVAIWNNDPPPGCTVEVSLPVAQGGD
jgi:PAS domain S-box-containing protein